MIDIRHEIPVDIPAREALLDRAFGDERFRKPSAAMRAGRLPAAGLSLVAEDGGTVAGTVRLWHVMAGDRPALLLGPLAVAADAQGRGIGAALMREALARAAAHGHGAVLLVGDAAYYERFGFSATHTGDLAMPGPTDPARFLAVELAAGALAGAAGAVRPTGAVPLETTTPHRHGSHRRAA